jgi:hypothetical protein
MGGVTAQEFLQWIQAYTVGWVPDEVSGANVATTHIAAGFLSYSVMIHIVANNGWLGDGIVISWAFPCLWLFWW